ncbi:DUF1643 domain-containing protein [Azospirillum sp. A26]|uniref:DUF1643 domain-containing protein n=1 Tax=Azospirillum sp. A26 TaxID=3160607 RepID=UPI00366EBC6E
MMEATRTAIPPRGTPLGDALPADWSIAARAVLSPSTSFRYWLRRDLEVDLFADLGAPAIFCMLNPSTADASEDDPTIRRCIDFATRWRAPWFGVVNLFAYRATEPDELFERHAAGGDVIGPGNDDVIYTAANTCRRLGGTFVCAWGGSGQGSLATRQLVTQRVETVLALLRRAAVRPHALRQSEKTGQPWHPLYLPAALVPVLWKGGRPMGKKELTA